MFLLLMEKYIYILILRDIMIKKKLHEKYKFFKNIIYYLINH